MLPNEDFVLKALTAHVGGTYTDGDHPNTAPDAYLYLNDEKVAVEVTQLVEQVICNH